MRKFFATLCLLMMWGTSCQQQKITSSPQSSTRLPVTLIATETPPQTANPDACQTRPPKVNLTALPKLPQDNLPEPRFNATLVYDPVRRVIVLFGGVESNTWEYDGEQWQVVVTPHRPSTRSWAAMTYDARRQVVIMFGGTGENATMNDLWEYDGRDWYEVQLINGPQAIRFPTLTYYPSLRKTILFGEYQDTATFQTWVYDGTFWENLNQDLPAIPDPVLLPQMVYDTCHEKLLLQTLGDWTYEFDKTWQILIMDGSSENKLSIMPASVTYDQSRAKLVHFGITLENNGGTWMSETWEFDGMAWKQVYPLVSPTPRLAYAMAFDEARGVTVLFGGRTQEGVLLNDLWEYDGVTWVER
jgi:hypothetical protein